MKSTHLIAILMIIGIFLSGCGQSPEEIATQTAAAWTSTPLPPTSTPTPTLVPFDLSINIQNSEGASIPGAVVDLLTMDDEELLIQESGDDGMVTWSGLPDGTISVSVTSQGYFPGTLESQIERGSNELVLQLDLDPNGLLPTQACGPGETLLYVDDFQDGMAQEWPEIEFNATGWSVGDIGDGNFAIVAEESATQTNFARPQFADAVWRLRFFHDGPANPSLSWLTSGRGPGYQVGLISIFGNSGVTRWIDDSIVGIRDFKTSNVETGRWYFLEISTFEGTINVWLDGESQMDEYPDPAPWGYGGMAIEPWMDPGSMVYFDDFSVCQLSDVFSSIYVAADEE